LIKAIDIPSEKLSPFFKKNEEICLNFENKIKEFKGSVTGSYGAWSFKAAGRIEGDPLCVYKIEKSTYTRDVYLFFKSLYTLSEWQYKSENLKNIEIHIKRKKILDKIGLTKYSSLNNAKYYVIKESGLKGLFVTKLVTKLKSILKEKQLISLSISNSVMKIKVESKDYSLDTANEIRTLIKNNN
jgi:hypothetical protein